MRFFLIVLFCFSAASLRADEEKLPIPENDAQQAELNFIREVYKSKQDSAKSKEQKSALARELIEDGINTKKNPVARYLMFRIARDIAVNAVDRELAYSAINEIEKYYVVNSLKMKLGVLTALQRKVTNPNDRKPYVVHFQDLLEEAIADWRLDEAKEIGAEALKAANAARAKKQRIEIRQIINGLEEADAAYLAAKEAESVLEEDPVNADANLTIGRFQCIYKGDWDKGVSMLALGSDEDVRNVAKLEMKKPEDEMKQKAIGDLWWKIAETNTGLAQERMTERAVSWYRKALDRLDGLDKEVVESRLKVLSKTSEYAENEGWLVLFRCNDASIWNTAVDEGKFRYAIPVERAPGDIEYLKLSKGVKGRDYIIIPIKKDQLTRSNRDSSFGWNGTNETRNGGHQLGIIKKNWSARGWTVSISGSGDRARGGWGFGSRRVPPAEQGYAWQRYKIRRTIFEISVKKGPLSATESSRLKR